MPEAVVCQRCRAIMSPGSAPARLSVCAECTEAEWRRALAVALRRRAAGRILRHWPEVVVLVAWAALILLVWFS